MPSHNVINLSHACICSVPLPSKSKSFDITRNRIGEFQWQVLEQHRDIRLFRTRGLGPLESLQRKATPGGIQIRRLSHLNWLSQHLYPKLKSTISFFCCCFFFCFLFCFFAAHPKPMTAAEGWNVDWLVLPSGSAPSSQQVWHNACVIVLMLHESSCQSQAIFHPHLWTRPWVTWSVLLAAVAPTVFWPLT